MVSRRRERKILDTLGDGRGVQPSGEKDQLRKDVPKRREPGEKRGKIVSPRKEEHKYVVPWAIVE